MERILFMSCIINEHIILPSLFYVIEMFPDPFFVTDIDGNAKTFTCFDDAANEAKQCQCGRVIAF
jgi:hypothetical protein